MTMLAGHPAWLARRRAPADFAAMTRTVHCSRAAVRNGWESIGTCGALLLLSDRRVIPSRKTEERRRILAETATALRHPPALVFGFVDASDDLTAVRTKRHFHTLTKSSC